MEENFLGLGLGLAVRYPLMYFQTGLLANVVCPYHPYDRDVQRQKAKANCRYN